MLINFPVVAAQASWSAATAGVPFGGCAGWLMVVICVDDSGEFGPLLNLSAAALGWPVALLCDVLLLPISVGSLALGCCFPAAAPQPPEAQ